MTLEIKQTKLQQLRQIKQNIIRGIEGCNNSKTNTLHYNFGKVVAISEAIEVLESED
jgi:hypothetical protein